MLTDRYLLPPTSWELPSNEVLIWLVPVNPLPADASQLRELLSETERARADRFYFDADRNRLTFGRGWLRRLLGHCLDLSPAEVTFDYGPQGKPSLTGTAAKSGLCFNLAHSHELVMIALAKDNRLGVDIEYIRPMPEATTIGRRHFTPEECRQLQGPDSERDRAFFRLWTRKEAVIKAVGTGLTTPLDRFDVSSTTTDNETWSRVSVDEIPPTSWAVSDLPAPTGYCAALAAEHRPANVRFWHVGHNKLTPQG